MLCEIKVLFVKLYFTIAQVTKSDSFFTTTEILFTSFFFILNTFSSLASYSFTFVLLFMKLMHTVHSLWTYRGGGAIKCKEGSLLTKVMPQCTLGLMMQEYLHAKYSFRVYLNCLSRIVGIRSCLYTYRLIA